MPAEEAAPRVFVEKDRVFFEINNREFEVVVVPTLRRVAPDEAAQITAEVLRRAFNGD